MVRVSAACKHARVTPHPPEPDPSEWRHRLDEVLAAARASAPRVGDTSPLALQVRVDGLVRDAARRRAGRPHELSVSVRAVRLGANGQWAGGWEVSWDALRREDLSGRWEPRAREWLAELGAMRSQGYWGSSEWTDLADFSPRLLWPHLRRGRERGVPFVGTAKTDVVALAGAAELVVDLARDGDALRLTPTLLFDGEPDPSPLRGTAGTHGLFAVTPPQARGAVRGAPRGAARPGTKAWTVTLGPTAEPLSAAAAALLDLDGEVEVPESAEEQLRSEYLPVLRQQVTLASADGSVVVPAPDVPTLVLTATFQDASSAVLTARWSYSAPSEADGGAPGRGRVHPFEAWGADVAGRDLAAEREILARAEAVAHEAGFGDYMVTARLEALGLGALDLAEELLPALSAVDGVRVDAVGQPEYTELTADPVISLEARDATDADWFDLAVTVTVEGRAVPLGNLFEALAKGRQRLLLVDGGYVRLDHPSLERLRLLISEADRISDRRSALRVSRHQAGLWDDLAELADVVEQSAAWRESVGGLLRLLREGAGEARSSAEAVPVPVPASVRAELRPYQQRGFEWLAFCWEHGLGGILADDMGLGKTLQTLTLIAHAREREPGDPPFLVVAPASVVGNWVREAARFTPGLQVAAVTATSGKKGSAPLAQVAAGADVVVTSYAVFRLDGEAFGALPWAGLVLDEAQFVKNHATQANRRARTLRAPFKLAITGTPLENSLTDLWALLAIVAPGLFPSYQHFREDYVLPVEAASRPDADDALRAAAQKVLARLQRRVRPLLLRRTKDAVAPELPERQEQVIAVELASRHRKVYDTHLARERQRVLGLLSDLEANRVAVFRALTTLRRLALDASLVDPEAYSGVPSSKLDVLFEQLEPVVAEGHRALVFSQFTGYLALVAERASAAGIPFVYLDGSTRGRPQVIEEFKTGTAPLFLISLKAGGFGLNLTEADYVYLLDPWWNPATEAQAVDRTHRIGQTRSVNVVRLVSQGTIEEKVMALKDRKARLVDAVLSDDAALFDVGLKAEDVRALLE